MFVKVSPYGPGNDSIYEVSGTVHFGKAVSSNPPSARDYNEELTVALDFLHVNGIDDEPGGYDEIAGSSEKSPWWVYSYAWWWEDDNKLVAAVTSQRIFILSESGDTIDRVR